MTAFFAFLRISNLAPYTARTFDHTRHLTKQDVIFGEPGIHLIIKWSKTLQTRDKYQVIQLPILKNKQICPVLAIHGMLSSSVRSDNSPLFVIPSTGVSVTQGQVRKALAAVLTHLRIPTDFITFHSFRRSGVTHAFNNNVSLQNLKIHGGWRSDVIWSYLQNTHKAAGQVARSFQATII